MSQSSRLRASLGFATLTGLLAIAGCTRGGVVEPQASTGPERDVAILQRINATAYQCWRNDPRFSDYSIIPELDTTGQPRILLLPRGRPQALPELVVTASESGPQTFGPLSTLPLAERINDDVIRWARGDTSCGPSA